MFLCFFSSIRLLTVIDRAIICDTAIQTVYNEFGFYWVAQVGYNIRSVFKWSCHRVDTSMWIHIWILTKCMEKKLDSNYISMLLAVLNKSWREHPRKQLLNGHQPPMTKSIKVRRTRHAGHYRRSKDELISDILLWTTSHGRSKFVRPARTYIQ